MIKQFYIKGFKAFSEPTTVDLADLLVIAGSNSGGKSSLIQALLLLAQTFENSRPDVALDLGGKYIQFSEFREAVYGRPKTKIATFTLGFNIDILENEIDFKTFRELTISHLRPRAANEERTIKQVKNRVEIRIEFGADSKGTPIIKSTEYQKHIQNLGTIRSNFEKYGKNYRVTWEIIPQVQTSPSKESILESLENINSNKDRRSYFISSRYLDDIFLQSGFDLVNVPQIGGELRRILNKKFRNTLTPENIDQWAKVYQDISLYTFKEGFSSTSILSIPFVHFLLPVSARMAYIDETSKLLRLISNTFGQPIREVREFLKNILYIGPLRAKPERAYLSTGTPLDIGNAGENAVPILWLNQNTKVAYKTQIGSEPVEKKLVKAVQEWLQEFELAYSFHITKPKRVIYQAEIESAPGSKTMVTIADVGFGVSQILPVIVAGLRAPRGATLILEQPEIHLHPKLQGKLADFLICLMELGKRVIVETHSEHLINMLRLRILQLPKSQIRNQIGILFVRNWKNNLANSDDSEKVGAYIENLKVDQYGKIINWPPDFFSEHSRLNEEILMAMIENFPGE